MLVTSRTNTKYQIKLLNMKVLGKKNNKLSVTCNQRTEQSE